MSRDDYRVAIFHDGKYVRTVTQLATYDAAAKCAAGVQIGAGLFVAGAVKTYVLPDDTEDMHEAESAEEASKVR